MLDNNSAVKIFGSVDSEIIMA